MLRTVVWFIYFCIYQVLIFPSLLKANRLAAENRTPELDALAYATAYPWAKALLKLAGCQVRITGTENIPQNEPVLFVSNHQSNFDIPILLASVGRPTGFIAKESLEKLPLVSQWMRHIHCVFIKRGSPRDAAVAINQGIGFLKAGYSMVIFPEGTRSQDGFLQEFKPGALKLATKASVPMVPIAIDGSIKMMRKGSFIIHPAVVTLTILPPILPEEYAVNDTVVLSDQIKGTIEAQLASSGRS